MSEYQEVKSKVGGYLSFKEMVKNQKYKVKKFRYVNPDDSILGYYIITLREVPSAEIKYHMVVKTGHLFNYLNNMRLRNITKEFTIQKIEIATLGEFNVVKEDILCISGVNDEIDLQ